MCNIRLDASEVSVYLCLLGLISFLGHQEYVIANSEHAFEHPCTMDKRDM